MGLSTIGHHQMKDEHCFESKVEAVLVNTGKRTELGIAIIVDTKHPLVFSTQSLLVPPNNVQLWKWNKYVKHSVSDQTNDTFNLIDSVEQLWFLSLPMHLLKQSVHMLLYWLWRLVKWWLPSLRPYLLQALRNLGFSAELHCSIYTVYIEISLPSSWLFSSENHTTLPFVAITVSLS